MKAWAIQRGMCSLSTSMKQSILFYERGLPSNLSRLQEEGTDRQLLDIPAMLTPLPVMSTYCFGRERIA